VMILDADGVIQVINSIGGEADGDQRDRRRGELSRLAQVQGHPPPRPLVYYWLGHLCRDPRAQRFGRPLATQRAPDGRLQRRIFELWKVLLGHDALPNAWSERRLPGPRRRSRLSALSRMLTYVKPHHQRSYSRIMPSLMANPCNCSDNCCRARYKRLITVPIGISQACAISL